VQSNTTTDISSIAAVVFAVFAVACGTVRLAGYSMTAQRTRNGRGVLLSAA
jgi:phosphatidylserine synthase